MEVYVLFAFQNQYYCEAVDPLLISIGSRFDVHMWHSMLVQFREFREPVVSDALGMTSIYITSNENTYRDLHQPALIIAACFVIIALVHSSILILQHLRSYTRPEEQKWIIAVLFMVPVYVTESILSLWKPQLSLACDILRNCYEAFALYSFGSYLIACLGGEERVIELLEDESRKLLSKPLLEEEGEKPKLHKRTCCNFFLQPCLLGKDLLTIEKFGLVQYMILKTFCAFLALVLELCGVYGNGKFKFYYGYPYIAVVLNFSQMWALYCLLQFYNVTHHRLEPIKPLGKFISFKAIIFATWWQGVGIALLCAMGVLPKEENFETGLQDFLICIEMAVAAVAHVFVFSVKPYNFMPAPEYGKVATTETTTSSSMLRMEEGDDEGKPSVYEKTETEVEAPGTSVKESVQDIVVEGGQHVVKDVVLTINQAIEPVEKGMTKIQETLLQISVSGDKENSEVKVEEEDSEVKVEEDEQEVKVEEHEQNITRDGSRVLHSEDKIVTKTTERIGK